MHNNGYWGKYREIILAVAMFLVLDLSVLILNFFISFQISEDALAINLSGRQRMLSQRITKSLLVTQSAINLNQSYDDALTELKNTSALFNSTLDAFSSGGEVQGSDGNKVRLAPITIPGGIAILDQSREIWQPLLQMHERLLAMKNSPDTLYQVDTMVRYAMSNNLKLLELMNQLTTVLEKSASSKANTLRLIQTGGYCAGAGQLRLHPVQVHSQVARIRPQD